MGWQCTRCEKEDIFDAPAETSDGEDVCLDCADTDATPDPK